MPISLITRAGLSGADQVAADPELVVRLIAIATRWPRSSTSGDVVDAGRRTACAISAGAVSIGAELDRAVLAASQGRHVEVDRALRR